MHVINSSPVVQTSTFVYNGLGLRVGKTDSTGTYRYLCDGTSPGADVLSDGAAVYTAGLSDHRGNASTFSHDDLLGSLRFLTTGQNVTMNLLPDAFGETVSQAGSLLTPFAWNGGSGYQSDAGGLKLLGHRYYDPRTGRFISQDHAKSGGNWYAYAGNNPVNKIDPSGLSAMNIFGAPSAHGEGPCGDYGFYSASQLDGMFGSQSSPTQPAVMDKGTKSKKGPTTYKNKDDAGVAAVKAAYPESDQDAHEYWGYIRITKDNKYQYSDPQATHDVNGTEEKDLPDPPSDTVGWYHTHPESIHGGADSFSDGDLELTKDWNVPGYLATPNFILKATPTPDDIGTPTVTTLQAYWH